MVPDKAEQTAGPRGNRRCGTQTDVSGVQAPLTKPTYADVATQAAGVRGPERPPMPAGRRTGLRPPPSRPSWGGYTGEGTGRVVGRAVVIHGILCEQGIQDILTEARGLRFRFGQRAVSARWLVNEHRHWASVGARWWSSLVLRWCLRRLIGVLGVGCALSMCMSSIGAAVPLVGRVFPCAVDSLYWLVFPLF